MHSCFHEAFIRCGCENLWDAALAEPWLRERMWRGVDRLLLMCGCGYGHGRGLQAQVRMRTHGRGCGRGARVWARTGRTRTVRAWTGRTRAGACGRGRGARGRGARVRAHGKVKSFWVFLVLVVVGWWWWWATHNSPGSKCLEGYLGDYLYEPSCRHLYE